MEIRAILLGKHGAVLGAAYYARCTDGMRAVIADALQADAVGCLLSQRRAEVWPDTRDLRLTAWLARAARPLGIRLHDHLILAGDACFSFRSKRLL